ncbi:MAG: hypothetical protein QM640_08445 [Niabella sp.]
MRLKLFFLLSLCSVHFKASCQTNFQPGYIEFKNGDTLKGYIDYRQWEVNPDHILFKTDPSKKAETYSVKDLNKFVVSEKDTYITAAITKDMRPVLLADLDHSNNDRKKNDTVFLRQIIESNNISLYIFKDFKDHFYIKHTGGDFEELEYKVYMRNENGLPYVEKLPIYRNQLTKYIFNRPDFDRIKAAINNTGYTENDLLKIVNKINGETGNMDKSDLKKSKNTFFISAGVLGSPLKYFGTTVLRNINFGIPFQPVIGFGIEFSSKRGFGATMLKAETIFHLINYNSSASTYNAASGETTIISYKLKGANIAPAVSIVYSFIKTPEHKVYAGGGVAYNISILSPDEYKELNADGSERTVEEEYLTYEKGWASFHVCAGSILSKKFEVKASYQIKGSFLNYSSISAKTNFLILQGIYRFK